MADKIRMHAVGDISFEGPNADHPAADFLKDICPQLSAADIVIANLESPLLETGVEIQGKCLLRGSPEWVNALKNAGITIVSLANNHVMDYGQEGLFNTIEALDKAAIYYVGAGENSAQACEPRIIEIRGKKIALLGRSSVVVNAPIYATPDRPGTAFLDVNETITSIERCRELADYVVLLVHWGLEEYLYPTPSQRTLARQFMQSGADVIIGHHPHVLQGMEYEGSSVVLYSLGNFIFNEFDWTYTTPDGINYPQRLQLSINNRNGAIARIIMSPSERPEVEFIPTRITDAGNVEADLQTYRHRSLRSISAWLKYPAYGLRWKAYAINREWKLRMGGSISFTELFLKLHKARFSHVKKYLHKLRRSAGIISGKTTNPYE